MHGATVRAARAADAAACARIYAPYVRDTAVSFETVPPGDAEMAARIEAAHAWLVAVDPAGVVVGYAYATAHRTRAAYRWACDVSVYVAPDAGRRGVGRALYGDLFQRLADRGFVTAFAGVALPNDASLALHRALGFATVGTYRHVGFKHGRWHDVTWLQRDLLPPPDRPVEPR